MHGRPLVSAIIPAYNAASPIDRPLVIVQAQTYPTLESWAWIR
jgi:glycosyltransferase involved in cell wall biosynthesis